MELNDVVNLHQLNLDTAKLSFALCKNTTPRTAATQIHTSKDSFPRELANRTLLRNADVLFKEHL